MTPSSSIRIVILSEIMTTVTHLLLARRLERLHHLTAFAIVLEPKRYRRRLVARRRAVDCQRHPCGC